MISPNIFCRSVLKVIHDTAYELLCKLISIQKIHKI